MSLFQKHRGLCIAAIALALGLIGTVLALFSGGRAGPVGNVTSQISRPISALSRFVEQNVSHLYGSAYRYEALLLEAQELREKVAALQAEAREGRSALEENERLRSLLGLSLRRPDFQYVACRPLRGSDSSWRDTLRIDGGADDGISVSDCVIDEEGNLLGIVEEVGSNWAVVRRVCDPGFSLGGESSSTRELGQLSGDTALMEQGQLKLENLERDTQVAQGDTIVTFSAEHNFPSGLPIGTVVQVLPDVSGMTSYAILETPPRQSLRQVFVICAFTGGAP